MPTNSFKSFKTASNVSHYTRTNCRLCESTQLNLVVPLSKTPIGGAFIEKSEINKEQELFSLDLYQCQDCGHVQLPTVINPELLFSNYSYFSGKTSLIKHFSEYAGKIMSNYGLKEGSFVVDIGSNDGAFLRFFKDRGIKVLGIDPAENVAKYANDSGIETLTKLFDLDSVIPIKEKYGLADVITANNVFAHTDDMIGMAKSVQSLLKKEGLFFFEISYFPDVVDKMLLGAIFHEHLCYHTIKPLVSFLQRNGLELINVERVPIQGGSIICTAQLEGGKRPKSDSVSNLISFEEGLGLYGQDYLRQFSQKLESIKIKVESEIKQLVQDGRTIAAFGAARGGTFITYYFNLGPYLSYIVDDDPEKQGLFSPGHHLPVLSTSKIYEDKPDYVAILAWVHSKSIINQNRDYLQNGGKFIAFFPEFKIIDKDSGIV